MKDEIEKMIGVTNDPKDRAFLIVMHKFCLRLEQHDEELADTKIHNEECDARAIDYAKSRAYWGGVSTAAIIGLGIMQGAMSWGGSELYDNIVALNVTNHTFAVRLEHLETLSSIHK